MLKSKVAPKDLKFEWEMSPEELERHKETMKSYTPEEIEEIALRHKEKTKHTKLKK